METEKKSIVIEDRKSGKKFQLIWNQKACFAKVCQLFN